MHAPRVLVLPLLLFFAMFKYLLVDSHLVLVHCVY